MSESNPAGTRSFDKQGSLPDAQRLQNAVGTFASDFGARAAIYMESCVRCGLCADACHFYVTTGDPKYTPINKIAPFERAYARNSGPLAPLYRLLRIGADPTIGDLESWEALIYDSCTLCGRCTLACPMGIDIAELVKEARHGMYNAGLVPERLAQIARNTEARHSPFGEPEDFLRAAKCIADEFGVEVSVNQPHADILVTTAPGDLEDHAKSFAGAARILNQLGLSWTYASDAFEATNFGFLSGNMELQKALTCRLIDKAVEIGAHTVLLPECGHAYGAARWEAAQWYGRPVPVRVMHMVEFLAEQIECGALALREVGESATFHDPCQLVRRGGLERAPRVILRALGFELRELADHGVDAYCCGGGGGVIANARAAPLRYKVFELKQRQVEDTGATHFVTSCGQCRLTFSAGAKHFNWDKPVESLLELVADNMVGDRKIPFPIPTTR